MLFCTFGRVSPHDEWSLPSGILLAVTTIYQYFEMFVKESGQDSALNVFVRRARLEPAPRTPPTQSAGGGRL